MNMNYKIATILLVGQLLTSCVNSDSSSVETIDILISKDFKYALENFYKIEPTEKYTIKTTDDLNEFHRGAVTNKDCVILDPNIQVYTWKFDDYSETLWVAHTNESDSQIIDALRYDNNVNFWRLREKRHTNNGQIKMVAQGCSDISTLLTIFKTVDRFAGGDSATFFGLKR